MKTEEFRALLAEYTQRTANICAFKKWNHSKVYKVADAVTEKIGHIVAFLQAKIDEGYFCKKNECLMIYDFQPVFSNNSVYLYCLDMIIQPLKEIDGLKNSRSLPVQLGLVINGTTGEIGNTAYGLAIIMGKEAQDESGTESEKPLVYGNYNDEMCSKPSPYNFVKQLNQLRATTEALKENLGYTGKGAELKSQVELSELPIHFSFQPTLKPEVFHRKKLIPPPFDNVCVMQEPPVSSQPAIKPEPFHSKQ